MEAVRQTLEITPPAFCLVTAVSDCEYLNDLFLGDLTNADNVEHMESVLLRLASNVGKLKAEITLPPS